jgi:hypothetical protein
MVSPCLGRKNQRMRFKNVLESMRVVFVESCAEEGEQSKKRVS